MTEQADSLRRALNLILAIALCAAPFLHPLTGLGQRIGAEANIVGKVIPEMPLGYAFSIWAPIFLAALAYGIHQALPAQRKRPFYRLIGWNTAVTFAAGAAWMIVAQLFGSNWGLVALIVVMLIGSLTTLLKVRAYRGADANALEKMVGGLFGVLSGWLSAAVFLNATSTIRETGLGNFGLSPESFAMLTLLPAGAFALFTLWRWRAGLFYAAGAVWALVAILLQNVSGNPNTPVAIVVGALIVAVVVAALAWRGEAPVASSR